MNDLDWVFKVVGIEKITDGDTYWLHLDVGFRQTQLTHLRLQGYDTPEIWHPKSEHEREKASEAKTFVTEWFLRHLRAPGHRVLARTYKDPDSFGRWLACLNPYDEAGAAVGHLGEELRDEGLASIWPTRWREEFDT